MLRMFRLDGPFGYVLNHSLYSNKSKVARLSGTAVKHGKLPVSISSITDDVNGQSDLTPVDPAGGHRYRNSIKTCESREQSRRTAQ